MGKKADPLVHQILEEARVLKASTEKKDGKFDPQSSLDEVYGSDYDGSNLIRKRQLIKRLGLLSHEYSPLVPTRVYGRTDRVPILNMTGPLKNHIIYAAANNVILYDYIKDEQLILPGHKNKIVTLAKDRRNKFFASADWGVGGRCTVIIWDTYTGNPHQALPMDEFHRTNGAACIDFAGILPFIGILGAEKHHKQVVSIWPYEAHRGNLKPAGFTLVPSKVGYQHQIIFHPEKHEFFATTGHRGICFYTWNRVEKKITHHVPKIPKLFLLRMVKFTHSIWSTDDRLLTATMGGFIVIWDVSNPVGLVEPPDPSKNIREFKRCYKIGAFGLTSFIEHAGFYVIGDDKGVIRFYDQHFRLLRWTKNHKLPPIYCVAFNESEYQTTEFQRAMRDRYDAEKQPHIHRESRSCIRDYTFGMRYFHQPSEATIEKAPFVCPDFFVGVAHGNIYYYHLAESRLDTVVHGANSRFVACDVNQVSNHLAMLSYKGEIHLYDATTNKMVCRKKLFKRPTRVTTLKFHPTGAFAFIGAVSGKIFYRRSFNWKPIDSPLDNCRAPIRKITFSSDGLYMAHYDKSRAVGAVGLYVNLPRKSTWVFKGKQRMHCKPIVDLMFYLDKEKNKNRLFSLGEDRRIIEYDIPNSSMGGGLKALTVTRIEQFSVPRAFTIAKPFPKLKPHILISNSAYKITVYDPDDRQIRKTCQGPVFGVPVNKMVAIKPEGRSVGSRIFTIIVSHNKIGFSKPPLDGNPYKFMAVLTHPSGIRDVGISYDHKSIYTIGNNETVGIQWRSNIAAVERGVISGGSGISPFIKMLDRDMPVGKSLVTESENCFYMLTLQKISSTKELLTSELRILVKEIPSVVRFCSYFPTEYEIDLMIEEAEFAGVADHGERNEDITFNEFVLLFANHRRFPSYTRATYADAFRKISKHDRGEALMRGIRFKRLLTTKGEKINEIDLPHLFKSVIRPVFEQQLQLRESKSQRKEATGRQELKKKQALKKEIVDIVKGKSFLDSNYSRNIQLPLVWKRDVKGKGKLSAINAHLAKQKQVHDNFPAMGIVTKITND